MRIRPTASLAWAATGHANEDPADSLLGPADVPTLSSIALRWLTVLFDEEEHLFAQGITFGGNGFRRGPTSRRHTIIALLGLYRLVQAGGRQPFDIEAIERAVSQDRGWLEGVGDLGLLIWLTALYRADDLETVLIELEVSKATAIYADGREAQTAGLALLLAGIAHARLACPGISPELTDVAVNAYQLLRDNQGSKGLFGHARASRFPTRLAFRRFGTFSDQMSAVLALSAFARAFDIEEPLEAALACGNAICALQGELGQWWSLYDKQRGRAAGRRPILSMQQYGMASYALSTLAEATGQNFDDAINKGISWMTRAAQIDDHLRTLDRMFVWDSIGPQTCSKKSLGALRTSRQSVLGRLGGRHGLTSDYFGWLLCAFGKLGLPGGLDSKAIPSGSLAKGM